MLTLDHIAVACTDLAEGTAWVQDVLGVPLQPGGQHPRYGTHNTLLSLGPGVYLEVIAKEPGATPQAGHSWFGLDGFHGPPALANWICATSDIATAQPVFGTARSLQRGALSWQITVPDDGGLPMNGGLPTLIAWPADVTHPSRSLTDRGCRLQSLDVVHPDADQIAQMITIADERVSLVQGACALRATIQTPHGTKLLS